MLEEIIMEKIEKYLESSIQALQKILNSDYYKNLIFEIAECCYDSINNGGKIMFIGNGGSAADAQHLATELVSRYEAERGPIPALALTVDTSCLTAISNDYDFDGVFARQLEALGKKGDTLFAISTSGNSKNVINAVNLANKIGIKTIALTGKNGALKELAHLSFCVPSSRTPIIQQVHITIGHIICGELEYKITI